jgi:trehalose/maltose hydrolase-like predicted phosphorylase
VTGAPRDEPSSPLGAGADVEAGRGDRAFDAVFVDWDGVADGGRSRVLGPLLERCSAHAIEIAVASRLPADALLAAVDARPPGPGHLLLWADGGASAFEMGPTGTVPAPELAVADGHGAVGAAARTRRRRGIGGGLVLVVVGGAASAEAGDRRAAELARACVVEVAEVAPRHALAVLTDLLEQQLTRRELGRVPGIDLDPAWVVELPVGTRSERVVEAIGTVANGWVGARACREDVAATGSGALFVGGVYTAGADPQLLAGPAWTDLPVVDGHDDRRVLDLRTGVLYRIVGDPPEFRSIRFASSARPHALGLRAEGAPTQFVPPPDAAGPVDDPRDSVGCEVDPGGDAAIAVARRDRWRSASAVHTVERLAAWSAGDPGAVVDRARELIADLDGAGFDRLFAEHRAGWARRWDDAEVHIEGAPADELAARFAVFHLLASVADRRSAAVGARGLTGPAYGGHVFWDADVFVLPALAVIHPPAARAMVQYRIDRLPAARAAAAARGGAGARFPWESAATGDDVTPRSARGPTGEVVAITTGEHEEHIVADVAWAIDRYAAWTGDDAALHGPGGELVLETARWWAARATWGPDGRAHVRGVMGPDEYHPLVDDNAFTNVMARWNLRRAADLASVAGADAAEAATWRAVADALVDGYDPIRGVHEQFAGYWDLEPLVVADVAPAPVAADLVLGASRVAGSTIIKQADVAMLHVLVPEDMPAGSLAADLDAYLPRTAHGSSLSPAVHALLLARAGRPDEGLELFRLAARMDLDDVTGTTAGGLHLATMGGLWQALAYGFLGLRPGGATLHVDPRLPGAWTAVSVRGVFRGCRFGVRADGDSVSITCSAPLDVAVAGGPSRRCLPPGATFASRRSA